ncbi:type 1 glutamine amidotransferase [Streptomyces sp. NPDC056910]|uniref:type 1 glutamine amidotransferase n=1 Tax=Streptomyces sp. NPDC056910 TaxID=3345964 RepID=UPI0036C1A0F8
MCRPWAGDVLPRSLDDHDALLVLGGSMGPHDDERAPWLPAVRELLRLAVARDVPTLAVCLGMELLTVACGGEVRRAALPEVGLCELTPLQEATGDRLFGPLTHTGGRLRAVQWHWEETGTLPDGAVPLVTSERCAHQSYRIGTSVWGVQFHPGSWRTTSAPGEPRTSAHCAPSGSNPPVSWPRWLGRRQSCARCGVCSPSSGPRS